MNCAFEHKADIKKVQSFIIILSRISSQRSSRSTNNRSKFLDAIHFPEMSTQNCWNQHTQSRQQNTAGKTLQQLGFVNKFQQNIKKYANIKEKYQHLLANPTRIRPSSFDCFKNSKNSRNQNEDQCFQEQEMNRVENGIEIMPVLRTNPFLLTILNKDHCMHFHLLKTIREAEDYKMYLAKSLSNHTIYALKMISKSAVAAVKARFARELKIQAGLDHRNIVKIYSILDDKHFFYVFYEPTILSLRQILQKKGRLLEKQIRDIIKQICVGVQHMHKHNILHQSIQLDSVFIQQGQVKISNFSTARYYPQPLQAENARKAIYSDIDIWNIGILTYQLLFDAFPIQIPCDHNRFGRDKRIAFCQEVDVSDSAKDFILGCLEKRHARRLSIHQMIKHAFLHGGEKYRWTTT